MDNREQKLPAADFAALVERAKAGDQDAFTALYEATNQEVYRTVRAMVRTDELALDIQQDAYVFAFTHLDQLGNPAKFRSWLRSIAANRTRSVLRKQTPVLFTELETEDGESFPELPDLSPESQPELSLERKETANLVREILDGLSDGQRLLVGMYYYEQIPVNRIAEDLGVSSGTVKTQLSRSRKKIEAAVKRLEKKGVKLFGLAPMPFLLALLKKAEPAAEAEQSVLAGSLAKAGVVTRSAAVHVGRSFFQTALGRVALGVITAGVIGGGVLGYGWVRDNLLTPIGDTQPPVSVESAEDLTTEPSETAEWESPEDLTTEPVTTEPTEPAATELTEPATTEPTERNTDPAVAADPGGHPEDPAVPTDPANPEPSQPTQPQPTDPQPTELAPTVSLLGWSEWNSSSPQKTEIVYNDCQPGISCYLIVYVQGEETPSLYSDNEAVTSVVGYQGKEDLGSGKWGHHWELRQNGSGSANLYCTLNGITTRVARTNNPEHGPALGYTAWSWWGECETITDAKLGSPMTLFSRASGSEPLELVSEVPSMFTISPVAADQMGQWYETCYGWKVTPNSTGTAHLYLKLGGSTVKTFTITVLEAEPPTTPDSPEDLSEQP